MSRLSRREFLWSSAASVSLAPVAHAAGTEKAKYLVVVVAEGGWDVTVLFDSKLHTSAIDGPEQDLDPDNPLDSEDVQTFGGIIINVNEFKRPWTTAFFEKWHSKMAVINGVWMGSIAHDPCRFRILSGVMENTAPDLATIVGYVHGTELPLGSIDLSGWSMNGPLAASAGRIGTNSQIKPLIDPATNFNAPTFSDVQYPFFARSEQEHQDVAGYLSARNAQLREGRGGSTINDRRLDDFDISVLRADRIRNEATGILSDLTLGTPASLITQASIAASLLKNGLCRSVTLDSRRDWDTHEYNAAQHANFDALFVGLESLMTSLENEGILNETLVCVVSEMTRTPKLNGSLGKDHWGHTSALLMGAGIRGGVQIGETTDTTLESKGIDYETGVISDASPYNKYENLCAGILEVLDVDPAEWFPAVDPFRVFQS
ncbi:MAG: DUF1501 domain-containing protein [Rhodobacterales bacterium]|nr:DUF1501 domain-containing protein [Rhodobacterales bacterium]